MIAARRRLDCVSERVVKKSRERKRNELRRGDAALGNLQTARHDPITNAGVRVKTSIRNGLDTDNCGMCGDLLAQPGLLQLTMHRADEPVRQQKQRQQCFESAHTQLKPILALDTIPISREWI